jgi:hypothetical protein
VKIVKGAKSRLGDIKKLWLQAFPEDTEFVKTFLDNFYKPSKCLLRYDGKNLVSMLFWLDVKIKVGRRVYKAAYLYGAATEITERHAGHFSVLHEAMVDLLRDKKYKFVIAIPANDGLFSLYRKLGYTAPFRRTEYSISTLDFYPITAEEAWERHIAECKASKNGVKILETRDMFIESVREHRFLGFEGGYFAFYMRDGKYVMYDVCDPEGTAPPYELLHYAKSAVLLDLFDTLDEEFGEREKPILNFMMN